MYRTEVFCSLNIEGIHCWPECPFQEVSYLKYPHRHLFHIKAYTTVGHGDRDVEFIMLKHRIKEYLMVEYGSYEYTGTDKFVCDFGSNSCEMIAKQLIEKFNLSRCVVSEDNENGSIVTVEG